MASDISSSTPSAHRDTVPDEKESIQHHETIPPLPPGSTRGWKLSAKAKDDGDTALALFADLDDFHNTVDPIEEKNLIRKIDLMILPYLAVCYAFFYIDKTTLSYSAIFGIKDALHLEGEMYSWLSSCFYFGFLIWAIPTNFLMQRLPIGRYLGFNIFMWGVFLMIQAACNSFRALAALRILAGMAEACSDPSFMLITSMWYTRRQQPVKIGIWYVANGCGIALGGLLGFAIGHIKGALPSWKYEFLIIGALCSVWGIVMFIFLPDSPVTAKGLTLNQRRLAVHRLRENQTGVENKHLKWYQVREAFLDVKLPLFYLLGLVGNVPNGGISNFGTLIIKGFGFSTLGTTLMQIPYGIFIAISILTCVLINDRLKNRRCLMILIFLCPNIAGAFGLRFVESHHKVGRYICYLLTGPYNAAFVMILSLQTANTAGHTKKVVTNAVLFLGYCSGNIVGPFFYIPAQSPSYSLGIWSMIVSHLLEVCIICTFWFVMWKENRRRDQLQGVGKFAPEGVSSSAEELNEERERNLEATAFGDLTDRENMNFRYIY